MFRFRLGSIPVEVHWSHLAFAALIGWSVSPQAVVTWVAVIFISVLFHELGHALVSLAFGYQPAIVLEGFGGHTQPNAPSAIPWHRDVLLTLAGPLFGAALGFACGWAAERLGPEQAGVREILKSFYDANLYWAVLNLIP